MIWLILAIIIGVIIASSNEKSKQLKNRQSELRKQNQSNSTHTDMVKCPMCLSTQISANKRGITFTTGAIGSQQVYITCLQCGHRWKAGK